MAATLSQATSLEDTITVSSDAGFTLEGGDGADVLEGGDRF